MGERLSAHYRATAVQFGKKLRAKYVNILAMLPNTYKVKC